MKTKAISLLLFTLLLFIAGACKEEDNVTKMSLSADAIDVAALETNLTLTVNSQDKWEVSSDAPWCVPDKSQGTGQTTLSITLSPNDTPQERTAILTITDPTASLEVKVTQGSEHYKLPVIFHVLYNDASNRFQNPKATQLARLITICNQRFANKFDDGDEDKNSVDLNLEFVMATTDPSGKTLAEPGVNRIKWPSAKISCDKFMSEENKETIPLVWDLSKYINIFLYNFEEENVLGISFIPYATSLHPLEGLHNADRYFANPKMTYPHCLSINNEYIGHLPEKGYVDPLDVTLTLAHELAHYLGLFHAFGVDHEKNGISISWRDDTDYCDDTPHYDRKGYEDWLINDYQKNTDKNQIRFSEMVKRTSSTDTKFISRNTMDYSWTFGNEFTSDQYNRIRHVLHYSPLVPGDKYDRPSTRAIMDAPIPPIRVIK